MINLGFLLEFNLSFVVLYLFYQFILKGKTDAALGRGYLLLIAPLALLIATMDIPLLPAIELPAFDLSGLELSTSPAVPIELAPEPQAMWHYLWWVYGVGAGLVLLYFLFALAKIANLTLRTSKEESGVRFTNSKYGAAFSFFAVTFVDQKYKGTKELHQLLLHEHCHTSSLHSLDLLYISLLCALMWFNPAVWMMFVAIRLEHERQADSQVIREGVEAMDYVQTLLGAEVGLDPVVGSTLSYQLTKNRIKMMTQRTSKLASLRALLLLPLFALLAVLFSLTPATAQNPDSEIVTNSFTVNGDFSFPADKTPYYIIKDAYGKVLNEGYGIDISKISPNDIFSMSVTKNEQAAKLFPEVTEPERGVVEIILKSRNGKSPQEKNRKAAEEIQNNGANKEYYFVIYDSKGKLVKSNHNRIDEVSELKNLSGVASIEILDQAQTKEKFPTISSDNAVIITLKPSEPIDREVLHAFTALQPSPEFTDDTPVMTAEIMPKFQEGSINDFRNWCVQNIKYPAEAHKEGIQGRVIVSFVVERDGTVSNVKVLRGVNKLLDDESVRVIASSPKWTPGMNQGKPVRFTCNLPLDFTLTK